MKNAYAQIDRAAQRARAARRTYAFVPPAELGGAPRHVPVVVTGAGPVGLAMARELGCRGIPVIVLEKDATSSDGSRAICWSKRSLEICDRLGVAARMLAKGVTWNVGKVYCGASEEPLYTFDLLPIKEQKYPAFINLQQYYTEEYLADAVAADPHAEVRWRNTVIAVAPTAAGVHLEIDTPAGRYGMSCDYLIAADGCRSPIRQLLGLDFVGRTFEDNFLIADVRMRAPFPPERRFFFNAPFNDGRTALMHQQPDDVWRLDFQLGRDIDRDAALSAENVNRKVTAMLGERVEFDYEWVSIYTFQCRRMERFVHDRVIFIGDAAHLVSPFGARGANGGLQDVDNLGWKLVSVLAGDAGPALLESYNEERVFAADENIANSTRATDFMTPRTAVETAFRDAVLELAADVPFARAFVNSGRLSVPCSLAGSPLITPDRDEFVSPGLAPGSVALDAPIAVHGTPGWFLEHLERTFVCMYFGRAEEAPDQRDLPHGVRLCCIDRSPEGLEDSQGLLGARYDAGPGTTYLIRPDQHIAARWRAFDRVALAAAWRRSLCL